MKYKILSFNRTDVPLYASDVAKRIQKYLDDGWRLHGGLSVFPQNEHAYNAVVWQAMVKHEM